MFAHILDSNVEPVTNLISDDAGQADATRFCQAFQPCGYIDAVTINFTIVINNLTHMDPDAEQQALIFRYIPVLVPEPTLNFDGHFDATDDAAEFSKDRISGIMVYLASPALNGAGQRG